MELEYKPSDDFVVKNLQPLVDYDVTGSKELWLIQCPMSQIPEINGKTLKVKLDEDGVLGGFEDSSGKEVDLVSFASQDADAIVMMPSHEESEIVGKISRRVSLVCYPEPKELLETMKAKTKQKHLAAVTDSAGTFSNRPAQSSRRKSGQTKSTLINSTSKHSKSIFSGFTETPVSKRKQPESTAGKHRSSSGTSDRSGKGKKKVKTEK